LDQIQSEEHQILDRVRAELAKEYPGEALNSAKALADWESRFKVTRQSPPYASLAKEAEALQAQTAKYLIDSPERENSVNGYSTYHGYVWLFLRK
jgi:hypothetical protein